MEDLGSNNSTIAHRFDVDVDVNFDIRQVVSYGSRMSSMVRKCIAGQKCGGVYFVSSFQRRLRPPYPRRAGGPVGQLGSVGQLGPGGPVRPLKYDFKAILKQFFQNIF